MRAGAIELVVEGTALMQHAVENIRRDPPRRETGHLGWQCEIFEEAWSGNISGDRIAIHAIGGKNNSGMGICQI